MNRAAGRAGNTLEGLRGPTAGEEFTLGPSREVTPNNDMDEDRRILADVRVLLIAQCGRLTLSERMDIEILLFRFP